MGLRFGLNFHCIKRAYLTVKFGLMGDLLGEKGLNEERSYLTSRFDFILYNVFLSTFPSGRRYVCSL